MLERQNKKMKKATKLINNEVVEESTEEFYEIKKKKTMAFREICHCLLILMSRTK